VRIRPFNDIFQFKRELSRFGNLNNVLKVVLRASISVSRAKLGEIEVLTFLVEAFSDVNAVHEGD
jgi:hypothetical protein